MKQQDTTCKNSAKKEKEYIRRLTNNLFSYTRAQLSALCGEIPMTLELFTELLEVCISADDVDEFFALCDDYPHLFQERLKHVKKTEQHTELLPKEFEKEDNASWNRLCEKIRKKYGPNAI